MTMRFEWTSPPGMIAPGELWPISGTATVVVNDNPLGWAGTVDARDPGGSLFALDSYGGSQIRVSSENPVGYTVTQAAITTCPAGGADFDLHIGSPNGNKDWSADFYYHYKWNP